MEVWAEPVSRVQSLVFVSGDVVLRVVKRKRAVSHEACESLNELNVVSRAVIHGLSSTSLHEKLTSLALKCCSSA